jgi:hypothetical protein
MVTSVAAPSPNSFGLVQVLLVLALIESNTSNIVASNPLAGGGDALVPLVSVLALRK